MSAILLRLLVYVIIIALIYFGIKRIINDWRQRFKAMDQQTRERDLNERERPDVVNLQPDEDGVYRADKDDKNKR
jgi:hypothetical protein